MSTFLSKKIEIYLKQKNFTQAELSKKSKLTPAAISNLVKGNREPSIKTLRNICNALDCTPNDLLGYSHSEKVSYLESRIERAVNILEGRVK